MLCGFSASNETSAELFHPWYASSRTPKPSELGCSVRLNLRDRPTSEHCASALLSFTDDTLAQQTLAVMLLVEQPRPGPSIESGPDSLSSKPFDSYNGV